MVDDGSDDGGVGDEGKNFHLAAALSAGQGSTW
jgi:hypothetical protein